MRHNKTPRSAALEALVRTDRDSAYPNIILNSIFKETDLDARDISFASRLFYGVLEKRITLDYVLARYSNKKLQRMDTEILNILRLGLYQLMYMYKVPIRAAVNESVGLTKTAGKRSAAGFVNGILRSFIRDGCEVRLPDKSKDRYKYLEVKYACPEWIIRHFEQDYGTDITVRMLEALLKERRTYIRVNTVKTTKERLKQKLEAQGVGVSNPITLNNALSLDNLGAIEENSCFRNGEFHIENLSSQICCKIIDPKPGETVYDVCAAPGGKAFTMAQMMNNEGIIRAFDIHPNRIKLIEEGKHRLGLSIIETQVRNAASDNSNELAKADRVLCDVPCSGLGVIGSKPDIMFKKQGELDNLVQLQYIILCKSAELVRKNGLLFYSTCTLNKKENDDNVEKFLREHRNFEVYDIEKESFGLRFGDEPKNQLTMFITEELDGFFVVAFRKRGT